MTADYFRILYEYDSNMNAQVLDLLQKVNEVDARTRQVFAHLLVAKKVWITRLQGGNTTGLIIWPAMSWRDCEVLIAENQQAYLEYLQDTTDESLIAEVPYTNSTGAVFSTSARDILTHVLIHSGYHRGQIAAAIRRQGDEPINTDYITFVRAHPI